MSIIKDGYQNKPVKVKIGEILKKMLF